MAIVEKTIGSGQDHTTISDWEANVGVFGTDTYKGIVSTNDEFNENVSMAGSTGTPSITSYLWLTVASANRHSGVVGTGHGRIRNTANSNVFNVTANFTRIEWLEIEQGSGSNSVEGLRIQADDLLFSYCIIWTDAGAANGDGIFWNGSADLLRCSIDNCIVYGFDRGGINFGQGGNTTRVLSAFIDHCAVFDIQGSIAGCIKQEADALGSTLVVDMFNTWGSTTGTGGFSPFSDSRTQDPTGTPDGSVTWNGSDNGVSNPADLDEIQGTNNMTAIELATDGIVATTKSSGAWIVVNNITAGSEDLLLLDDAAGNIMAGRGINRQGSEPDTRQDFSVDITGGARPTSGVDIGPHQVSGAAPAAPVVRRRQLTTVRM